MQLNQPGSIQKQQGSSFCTAQIDWQGNTNVSERIVTRASQFKVNLQKLSYKIQKSITAQLYRKKDFF